MAFLYELKLVIWAEPVLAIFFELILAISTGPEHKDMAFQYTYTYAYTCNYEYDYMTRYNWGLCCCCMEHQILSVGGVARARCFALGMYGTALF